jgi:predicted ribosome quality control (RQC) complex YloA/Tae2 family protein
MKKIPEAVIQDWVKNKKRIEDRLNRIKKRLKKYEKQKAHFEMRLRLVQEHDRVRKNVGGSPAQNGSIKE